MQRIRFFYDELDGDSEPTYESRLVDCQMIYGWISRSKREADPRSLLGTTAANVGTNEKGG